MNLGDLEFKAEDFGGFNVVRTNSHTIALLANSILREKLAKAIELKGVPSPSKDCLLRARLVCIEEIGK